MPTVPVRDVEGKVVGEVELSEAVFAAPVKPHLLYEVVRWQMAKRRRGTASTKTRGEVSGGGRKPWPQKGTGRARAGSIRSPLWVGGGVVFGPKPRDYSWRLPKKVRRNALRSALSMKLAEGRLVVVDRIELEQPKTKAFLQIMGVLGVEEGALVVDEENRNLALAVRNLPRYKLLPPIGVNVYDLLGHPWLVLTRRATEALERRCAP